MPRKDYEKIKEIFENIVKTFRSKDSKKIQKYLMRDIKSYFSVFPSHFASLGKEGIDKFITTFPKTDELHLPIYNYACCLNSNEAQAYGQVVAIATNERTDSDQ